MAIDEALLACQLEFGLPPAIRVYQFDPPTLSIGYFQSMEREVDINYCKKRGFDFVRRPTGGRAVLHDRELTYSITIAYPHKILDMNFLDSFHFLSKGIIKAIELLGGNAYFSEREDKEINSSSCFAAPTFSDILINGRKVVGSAQLRNRTGLLQHGSVLYHVSVEDIFNALKVDNKNRESIVDAAKNKITSLSDELERDVSLNDVKAAFKMGMQYILEDDFVESSIEGREMEVASNLYKQKYSTFNWNFKR